MKIQCQSNMDNLHRPLSPYTYIQHNIIQSGNYKHPSDFYRNQFCHHRIGSLKLHAKMRSNPMSITSETKQKVRQSNNTKCSQMLMRILGVVTVNGCEEESQQQGVFLVAMNTIFVVHNHIPS